MLLKRLFTGGTFMLGLRKMGLADDVRFADGAADSVKVSLLVSAWPCCKGSGGRVSFFVPMRGEGMSDKEGIAGKVVEFKYSFPKGVSRACAYFKP